MHRYEFALIGPVKQPNFRKTWPALLAADWDTNRDDMSDDWEKARSLNPSQSADATADRDRDGYTNLEEYLGCLVGESCDRMWHTDDVPYDGPHGKDAG